MQDRMGAEMGPEGRQHGRADDIPVFPEDPDALRTLIYDECRQALGEGLTADEIRSPTETVKQRARTRVLHELSVFQELLQGGGRPEAQSFAWAPLAISVLDDILGMGPLQPLMDDPAIEEIIVNSVDRVITIGRGGKQHRPDASFRDAAHLERILRRALEVSNTQINWQRPIANARLQGGHRISATLPPCTDTATMTIRKHSGSALTMDDLVRGGMLGEDAAEFLTAAARAGLNMLVSGGTASGKTTMLNALLGALTTFEERVVTCEEIMELAIGEIVTDCVQMEGREDPLRPELDIPLRALVRNAMRMRPTRVIVGEVRGEEALDLLTAMNSGHDGSMCTIHANGARDGLEKLATLARQAKEAMPLDALTRMISSSVDLVIHLDQALGDRRRVVSEIFEVHNATVTVQGFTDFTGMHLWTRGPGGEGDLVFQDTATRYSAKLARAWTGGSRPWLRA